MSWQCAPVRWLWLQGHATPSPGHPNLTFPSGDKQKCLTISSPILIFETVHLSSVCLVRWGRDHFAGEARRRSVHETRLGAPDVGRVFADCPIAGEFPRAGDVEDGFAAPPVAVRVEVGDA